MKYLLTSVLLCGGANAAIRADIRLSAKLEITNRAAVPLVAFLAKLHAPAGEAGTPKEVLELAKSSPYLMAAIRKTGPQVYYHTEDNQRTPGAPLLEPGATATFDLTRPTDAAELEAVLFADGSIDGDNRWHIDRYVANHVATMNGGPVYPDDKSGAESGGSLDYVRMWAEQYRQKNGAEPEIVYPPPRQDVEPEGNSPNVSYILQNTYGAVWYLNQVRLGSGGAPSGVSSGVWDTPGQVTATSAGNCSNPAAYQNKGFVYTVNTIAATCTTGTAEIYVWAIETPDPTPPAGWTTGTYWQLWGQSGIYLYPGGGITESLYQYTFDYCMAPQYVSSPVSGFCN